MAKSSFDSKELCRIFVGIGIIGFFSYESGLMHKIATL
jgi:hypothetical protein